MYAFPTTIIVPNRRLRRNTLNFLQRSEAAAKIVQVKTNGVIKPSLLSSQNFKSKTSPNTAIIHQRGLPDNTQNESIANAQFQLGARSCGKLGNDERTGNA